MSDWALRCQRAGPNKAMERTAPRLREGRDICLLGRAFGKIFAVLPLICAVRLTSGVNAHQLDDIC